ncbi:centromere-associated protein E-like isoform X2 [Montipora foliosa]|uniref:centromere-associated protein E-like isoform X2 n=1 Tax=Montipora foliosa TaxID=591990 RepID=UPI0035F185C2
MAASTDNNIRVAIRVRPFIKRERDCHLQTHWRVDKNTITQVSNGKLLQNSSYSFDQIFDVSSTTQDVYDEFGQPIVLSAMDGFNGTLFAYGQTSSGKTYTMMGDQRNEGVIPKAVGEIYDYIEKHPSREFLIRVSYMEIYNEDIRDLLNPAKTNLKVHENAQRQVYVGDLTEEVVACGEDVFKHMFRGEKNRHFGETNMNDRSSRSHTIFRVVIESREMMDESKDPDTIDGAVRVAHLNLVDLAGSERASQTGAFGQRLKEGGHINKSLLALGSVIAKLSEGESFVPFRDSKLTRILQSSLGGNAKTSMICTITTAAVEETISTLKFASRAKTIKNCPEVNEVLDDGTLLKRYRKEICELKKQLTEMSQESSISRMQELQVEKEKMVEMLEQQRIQQSEQEQKIKRLRNMICSAGREDGTKTNKEKLAKRRLTWCPGAALSKAPLTSAAAVQARLARIDASPSEESEFDEIPKEQFFSSLDREEETRSKEFRRKRVGFISPQATRCLSPVLDTDLEDKDMQTEPDERITELENEMKSLRRNLDEAVQTRDFYNELLVQSNELLEKMSTEKGLCATSMNSDVTLKYVAELRNENANLQTQLEVLKTQNQEMDTLKVRNKELTDEVQSLKDERTLSNEYISELQTEHDSLQAEKQDLAARVDGLESKETCNMTLKMDFHSLQMKLEENVTEKNRLHESLESWKQNYTCLQEEVVRLQNDLACEKRNNNPETLIGVAKSEMDCLQLDLQKSTKEKQELLEELVSWKQKFACLEEEFGDLKDQLSHSEGEKMRSEERVSVIIGEATDRTNELDNEIKELREKLSIADEQERMLTDVIEQKLELEETFENLKAENDQRFEVFKQEKQREVSQLVQEIEQLRSKIEESKTSEYKNANLPDENSKKEQTFERQISLFKKEKDEEIAKLTADIELLHQTLDEKRCSLEEKERLLKETMQGKSELDTLKSDLTVDLEKMIDEKKEVEQMLDRVKKERDEIKNDLSESISDSVELQKEMMEMQQQLKSYKEHVLEVEKTLEEKNRIAASYKEKMDDLQYQLSLKSEKVPTENNCEYLTKDPVERENLTTLLTQEQERAQELSEQCSFFKSTVEQLKNAKQAIENEAKKLRQESDGLRVSIEELDKRLAETEQRWKSSEERLHEEREKCKKLEIDSQTFKSVDCGVCKDLQKQLNEMKQVSGVVEKQLEGERVKNEEFAKEIEQHKKNEFRARDITESIHSEVELQKSKKEKDELLEEFAEERKAHETLRKEHTSLSEELQHLKDSLLRDTNRGIDQQRVIDQMKAERRETICMQAQQRQELEKDLHNAEAKASELESQCSCLKVEKDLLEHRLEVANKQVEEIKQEMRDMENLYSSHNTRSITHLDENRALQKLKQMELSVDLTKQKCEKAEGRVKELENENRELKWADIRNNNLLEERDKLRQQVQQVQKTLDEKSKKLSEFSIEVTQLRTHIDRLSDENKKNRSSLEKKDNKIDNLEQKLWAVEEELKLEKQRHANEEEGTPGPALEELNSTIRVKHEELEHMTFLVDEKDIEIAEVRSSLQENEAIRTKITQNLRNKEDELKALESELESTNVRLLEAHKEQEKSGARILELKAIIERQEKEIILITERLESENVESEIQNNELGTKRQGLENDMQCSNHRLLEVESELEYVKTSWEKATNEKRELIDILQAYSKSFGCNDSTDLTVTEESLRAQLRPNLERLSSLLKSANELEDVKKQLKSTVEERRLLGQKLDELQTLFKEQKTSLEEEVDELRGSVLNEKKFVFELEDKVKFAVNDKMAMEAELRRVLEQNEANSTHGNMETKMAAYEETECELRLQLQKAKESVIELESEVANLKEGITSWESLAMARAVALEEEKTRMEQEMAQSTQCFEEEKQQLLEQLREISTLKVKESEDFCIGKREKIEELEKKLSNAAKSAEDYERSIEHYQLKVAKLEYERDTAKERLEKQISANTADNNEIESLRQECELAKKKCKDAQEKYFSESDRLKAIIDEMQDEQDEFARQIDELKEKTADKDSEIELLRRKLTEMKDIIQSATNSSNSADKGELESLRKECEVAKKKCKDAQEKYFCESDRLKAIIDEMQDEQDEYVRQMNELNQETANKDAEINQLKKELTEIRSIADSATNSTSFSDKSELEALKKECELAKKKCKDAQEKYFSESDRLKAIIDEMQDEQDEYVRQIDDLKKKTANKQSEVDHLKREVTEMKNVARSATRSSQNLANETEVESLRQECELEEKKCKDAKESYLSESDRLKSIIDEMQDEEENYRKEINELKRTNVEKDAEIKKMRTQLAEMGTVIRQHQGTTLKSQNKHAIEDEMETTRIDLAQKNMQIQSLQYDLYKLQEKYEKEMRSLNKEVEFGKEKIASLKQEIRRLKEPEQEDTVCMMRGHPVPAKQIEVSNVGVVSNVAIYALKAKVGKLETETEKLNKKVQQLEREKATLSLLNTEASNKFAQVTSENKALKTQRKKLIEEVKSAKAIEEENVSRRTLLEATNLGVSSVEGVSVPTPECKRIKAESPKENFQSWLSGDAANNLFKEEPNQCTNQ